MRVRQGARLALGLVAVIALAACSSQSTASVPASGPEGGGYVDVAPAQLVEMLQAKDFTFVNVPDSMARS